MELIVTKADVILCEYCYAESKDEQDPTTHYFSTIKYGECSCCHYKIKKTLTDGYYWIKLRNDHWFIGELLAGDWYVCGMERCLSHQPVEIGQRIERTANG